MNNQITIKVLLCLSFVVTTTSAAVAESHLAAGAYTGNYTCSFNGSTTKGYVKWEIDSSGQWYNAFPADYEFVNDASPIIAQDATSQSYYADNFFGIYLYRDGQDIFEVSSTTVQIMKDKTFSAIVKAGDGISNNLTGMPSATCSGKLTFTPFRNNIYLSGNGSGVKQSKCFNVKTPTKLHYAFIDSGGFYALFSLRAQSCGRSATRRLYHYSKWTNTAAKIGTVKVPVGRWRFIGRATDFWYIEGLPGVK